MLQELLYLIFPLLITFIRLTGLGIHIRVQTAVVNTQADPSKLLNKRCHTVNQKGDNI